MRLCRYDLLDRINYSLSIILSRTWTSSYTSGGRKVSLSSSMSESLAASKLSWVVRDEELPSGNGEPFSEILTSLIIGCGAISFWLGRASEWDGREKWLRNGATGWCACSNASCPANACDPVTEFIPYCCAPHCWNSPTGPAPRFVCHGFEMLRGVFCSFSFPRPAVH